MSRITLPVQSLSPEAATAINTFHRDIVNTVSQTVAKDKVVVIGMGGNPWVKKATQALQAAGIDFTYLGYGGYMSQWKERLAIKLWSGWPTFPQVFVRGVLIGGATDTIKALADGTLKKRLESK